MTLTGPIIEGTRPNAFGSPIVDLAGSGYVEEEFFLEGEASAYAPAPGTQLGVDGRWNLQPSRTAPFKTRMLVLRPKDTKDFSGNVPALAPLSGVAGHCVHGGGGERGGLLKGIGECPGGAVIRNGVHVDADLREWPQTPGGGKERARLRGIPERRRPSPFRLAPRDPRNPGAPASPFRPAQEIRGIPERRPSPFRPAQEI